MFDLIGDLIDLLFWVSVGKSAADRPTSRADVPPDLDPAAWLAASRTPVRMRDLRVPVDEHHLRAGRVALLVIAVLVVATAAAVALGPPMRLPEVDVTSGSAILVPAILGPLLATVASLLTGALIAALAVIRRLDITPQGAGVTLVAGVLAAPVLYEVVLFASMVAAELLGRPLSGGATPAEVAMSVALLSIATWFLPVAVGVGWTLVVGRALAATDAFGVPVGDGGRVRPAGA